METTHQLNIVLVAEEATGARAFNKIYASGHNLMGVLTNTYSSVAVLATNVGIPVVDPGRVQQPDFALWMTLHHIDVLLNVHSLYRICPEVIAATRVGAFNLHPGPLPAYSGLNAPSWAVYDQKSVHAVTLHWITETLDAGSIVYETEFPLSLKDTGLTVSVTSAQKGMDMIERLLDTLQSDPTSIPSRKQDLTRRRFYSRNNIPGNGWIYWSDPAHTIDAFVRACNYSPYPSPWGSPKTRWKDKELIIFTSVVSDEPCDHPPGTVRITENGKVAISASDYWIFVDRCKLDGEMVMTASFLNQGDVLVSGKT